jgi:endoglucanase
MKNIKYYFYLLVLIIGCHEISQSQHNPNNDIQNPSFIYDNGGIIRTSLNKKEINLVFTAHDFGDGGEVILKTLKKQRVKGSFFFTGDFYRNNKFKDIITRLIKDGHYLGGHSDKHLLYVSWENRDSLLVSKEDFQKDLKANYKEMERFGINKKDARYFLPPYEWFNRKNWEWCKEMGLKLVNFTPGTSSNADYTYPEMGKKYLSSDTILQRIFNYEQKDKYGLNGFILLIHFGTDPRRTDKLYNKLDELINELKKRGYKFTNIKDTVK